MSGELRDGPAVGGGFELGGGLGACEPVDWRSGGREECRSKKLAAFFEMAFVTGVDELDGAERGRRELRGGAALFVQFAAERGLVGFAGFEAAAGQPESGGC